jgi:hypothetical protein
MRLRVENYPAPAVERAMKVEEITRKRIGFALSDSFRRSLLETRTLTNTTNSETVPLRELLTAAKP